MYAPTDFVVVDDLARHLYKLADENAKESPLIGELKVTDILKAQAAGVLNGTAERLHGQSMAGIAQTFVRVGRTLAEQGDPQYSFLPVYKTTTGEDGVKRLIHVPSGFDKQGNIKYDVSRQTLDDFGYHNRVVYCTADPRETNEDTGVPVYHPKNFFSADFFHKAMAVYSESNHCRPGEYVFHIEILRGQLALWYLGQQDLDGVNFDFSVRGMVDRIDDNNVGKFLETYRVALVNTGLDRYVAA